MIPILGYSLDSFLEFPDCSLSSYINFSFKISQLESICEDAAVAGRRDNPFSNFIPALRSGEWSDIGGRRDMEDTHVCITDLAKNFGYDLLGEEVISFYGVSSLTYFARPLSVCCDSLHKYLVRVNVVN